MQSVKPTVKLTQAAVTEEVKAFEAASAKGITIFLYGQDGKIRQAFHFKGGTVDLYLAGGRFRPAHPLMKALANPLTMFYKVVEA